MPSYLDKTAWESWGENNQELQRKEKIQLKRRQVTRCSPQSQLLEGKQQNEMGSNKASVSSLIDWALLRHRGWSELLPQNTTVTGGAGIPPLSAPFSLRGCRHIPCSCTSLPGSRHLAQRGLMPDLNTTYYSRLAKSEHRMALTSVTDAFWNQSQTITGTLCMLMCMCVPMCWISARVNGRSR